MNKFILLLLFFTSLLFSEVMMSKPLMEKLAEVGKPYDLSYTLQAIVEVESSGGKYKVNLQDPSCGITMIHIEYFLKRNKIKDTPFYRNRACQALINDDDLAIGEAIAILLFWKNKFCSVWGCTSKQWHNVWAAYNGGYNYRDPAPQKYARKIRKKIAELKRMNNGRK